MSFSLCSSSSLFVNDFVFFFFPVKKKKNVNKAYIKGDCLGEFNGSCVLCWKRDVLLAESRKTMNKMIINADGLLMTMIRLSWPETSDRSIFK